MSGEPFSDFIAWRETMGLNTYEAAEALGISRVTLHKIQSSGEPPKLTVRLAMEALSARGEPHALARRVAALEERVSKIEENQHG